MKKFYEFRVWCENATSGIRYAPDRQMVYEELLNHLYDHYDALVEDGMDHESARKAALEAMGNARQIAPQLAAIHRPFWGYLLSLTRVALAIALCAVVICGGLRVLRTDYHDESDSLHEIDHFNDTQVQLNDMTRTRVFYTEPEVTACSDGYTFTLTKAAVWHTDVNELGKTDTYRFYFQIDVFNPRPWAEHRDIIRWFYAVDSLGNIYDCYYDGIINYAPYISGNDYPTGPLTYTHDMWISDYRSEDAEWIEFRYDRSGRSIALRLDLTGGDAA